MPGKYSHLKGQLTQFQSEPEYQARVQERKQEIIETLKKTDDIPSMANLGYVLLVARNEKDRLETLVKDENLTIEATHQMLLEMMEGEDLTNLKLTNGASLSIKDDVYCTVSDRPSFYTWIRQTGQDDLLTVNYQTMASLVKKRLTGEVLVPAGEEATPPGIDVYFKQSITVRGGKDVG